MAADDLSAALNEISSSLGSTTAENIGQLRQQAAANNQQLEKIVRDLFTAVSSQNKSISDIAASITQEKTTEQSIQAQAVQTTSIAQQQLSALSAINTSLVELRKAFRSGFDNLSSSQDSLIQTINDTSRTKSGGGGLFGAPNTFGGAYKEGGALQALTFALTRGLKGLGGLALSGAATAAAYGAQGIPSAISGATTPEEIDRIKQQYFGLGLKDNAQFSPISRSGYTSGYTGEKIEQFKNRASSLLGFGGGGGNFAQAGSQGGGKPVKMTGSAAEAIAFFESKGWTKEQATGLAANLQVESKFKTDAVGDSGTAYGIAQWHPDRQRNFERTMGIPISQSNFKQQLEFVNYELTQGQERGAGNKIRQARTAEDAAAAVDAYYERSSGAHRAERVRIASSYYNQRGQTQTGQNGSSGGAIVAQDTPTGQRNKGGSGGRESASGTTAHQEGHTEYGGLHGATSHGMISGLPSNKEGGEHGGKVDKSSVTGKSLEGVNSELMNRFLAAATEYKEKTGRPVNVTSGLRTADKQAELYAAFKAGRGLPANPPGKSNHETGNAIDSSDASQMAALGILQKHGLAQTAGSKDPVHIQLSGTGSSQASYGSGGGERTVAQDAQQVSAPPPTPEASYSPQPGVSQRGPLGGGSLGTFGIEAFQASGIGPRSGIPSSALTSTFATGAPLGIGGGLPGGIGGLGGFGGGGFGGILGQLLPNILGAGQVSQINQLSQQNEISQSKQMDIQKQMLEALNNQQGQASNPSSAYYPQKGTDYNNPDDISFGPAWPEIVGQAYPEYGDKVRLNPFKRR
jgi:hypothetical protein